MKRVFKTLLLIAAIAAVFVSCEKNFESASSKSLGQLVVKLTDAPFPVSLVDQALVTIDKIEIGLSTSEESTSKNKNKGAGEDTCEFIVISEETQQFDLLKLTNGITADLVKMEIPTGKYDMIRMHVVESKVVLKDGQEFDLKIPSSDKSGLKIKIDPALVVEEGAVVNEVLLDFDVSKSFIVQGNAKSKAGLKGFMFKPVIRAVSQKQCSQIEGYVYEGDKIPVKGAYVQLMRGDSILTGSFSDEKGNYALIGIPSGTYTMKCEKEGYTMVVREQVKVQTGKKTTQDFKLE